MGIYEHRLWFAGSYVKMWPLEEDESLTDQDIVRVSLDWGAADAGERWTDAFADYLDTDHAKSASGLVVGIWDGLYESMSSERAVEALVTMRDRLPKLKAMFLGDITGDEFEISWIEQADVSPIFDAYPQLEVFKVRGGNGLRLGALRHEYLKTLVIESGGLAAEVIREIMGANLPELEHLEIWLGDPNYGATTTVDDLAPLLEGKLFPKLRYLGLRDSHIATEIAIAIADAEIVSRLETLDLSLGTLVDEGAQALVDSERIKGLKKLDLHHHFCSDEMMEKLNKLPIWIDSSDKLEPDEWGGELWRYVAVSE